MYFFPQQHNKIENCLFFRNRFNMVRLFFSESIQHDAAFFSEKTSYAGVQKTGPCFPTRTRRRRRSDVFHLFHCMLFLTAVFMILTKRQSQCPFSRDGLSRLYGREARFLSRDTHARVFFNTPKTFWGLRKWMIFEWEKIAIYFIK